MLSNNTLRITNTSYLCNKLSLSIARPTHFLSLLSLLYGVQGRAIRGREIDMLTVENDASLTQQGKARKRQ